MKTDNEFIKRYTPIVRREVNRVRHEHLHDDLMQEGYYGLLQAAQHYTEACGEAFETYAARWIRRVVKNAIRTYGYPVSIPKHTEVEEGTFVPINTPMEDEEGNQVTIEVTTQENGETLLVLQETGEALDSALHMLSQREQIVIRKYYGIGCKRMKSVRIGQKIGARTKIVHQMRERALKKMQKKCK